MSRQQQGGNNLRVAKPLDSGASGIKRKPEAPITELPDVALFVNLSEKPHEGLPCSLCGITVTGKDNLDQHFKGKKHKHKKIEAGVDGRGLLFKDSLIQQEVQEYGFGENQNLMSRQQQRETHVMVVEDEKKWICLLCLVTTTSDRSLHDHVIGKMHQAKLAKQKALAVLATTKPVNKNADNSEAFVEENDPLDKKFEPGPFGYKQIPDRAINSKQQYGERSDHWNAPYDGFQGGSGSLPPNPGEWKRLTPELHPPSVTEEWRWEGTIKKGGTPVCQARCFPVGKALDMPLPEYLDCTARTGLDILEKHYYQAASAWVVFFVPGSDADSGYYNEFMKYLEEKQRATVVKLDESTTLFLVPPSEFSEKVLKVPGKLRISGVVLRLEHPGPNQGSSLPHPPVKKETNFMSYRGDASYPKPTSPPPGQFPLVPFQNRGVQENSSSSYTPTSPGMMGMPLGGSSKSSHQQTTPQVSSSAPVSGLQPGKLVQLASSLLGQPRQSGGGPPLAMGEEFRQSGSMNHSENSYGTPQRYTPQNNQFGQVQPQQQQQQASNVAARNQQMQSGNTQEEDADPLKRLQATLQLAAALLAHIQQGKGN